MLFEPVVKPLKLLLIASQRVGTAKAHANHGDSITDLNLALAASLVFARPPLTNYLEEQSKSYIAWTDFMDVRDRLAKHLTFRAEFKSRSMA